MGSELSVFAPYILFHDTIESCLEGRVERVCFDLSGLTSVMNLFEVLRFF